MINIGDYIKFKVINNIVFGGAGFLGSHLIDSLILNGENVVCIDNLSSGNEKNINHLKENKKFSFIKLDILNPLNSNIKIERIWHLACPASPNIYQNDPLQTIRVNYEGTLNILNLASIHNSKLLFTSTSEIYGITENNLQYESMPINISTYSPRACYSEGKRIAETLINTFRENKNLDVKIARVFNTYGPRLDLNDGRVIGNFIRQSIQKKTLTIYGDGLQTRSFCYVSDLIEALIKLMESNYFYPINLGNDREISIIELANIIRSQINKKVTFEYCKLPSYDPKCRKPSLEKARKILKWNPNISLSEGLKRTISYYVNLS